LLPGGEWLLFAVSGSPRGWNDADIVVESLLSGERKVLIRGGSQPRYVPTGHLIYGREGALFAVPFDVGSLEVTPGPVPVAQNVRAALTTGAVDYVFSTSGHLVYVPGRGGGGAAVGESLVWIDREGQIDPLPVEPRVFARPRLSPDERRLAVQVGEDDDSDIWIFEVERGAAQRLTVEGDANRNAVWSPDGEWVYFSSDRGAVAGAELDIWRKRADRSGAAEPVLQGAENQFPHAISADGATLFYYEGGSFAPNIGMLSLTADAEPEMLVESDAATWNPWPSPDGRFVAFETNESGGREVMVIEIATGKLWPVSTNGGRTPVWSRDGSAILYYQGAGQWYSAAVSTEPTFSADVPEFILDLGRGNAFNMAVSADAQRFLTTRRGDLTDPQTAPLEPAIHVVLNWFQELKALVPTGR
jgi:dipeptidyl aminopeptidase/acylaminoacyl peptidase